MKRWYPKQIVIYFNGREETIKELTVDNLQELHSYKVRVKTKQGTYIGYLDFPYFHKEDKLIRVLTDYINKERIYIDINFKDIKDIEGIKEVTFNPRKPNFIFDPENDYNPLTKRIWDNNLTRNVFLEYSVVHQGSHIDGYSRGIKGIPYLCSCNKLAITNLIKMYEKYIQYDPQIKDRNELLLEVLGLPEYYNNVIRKSHTNWSIAWLKYLKFKDNICPVCNKEPFTEVPNYHKYITDRQVKLKKEFRRRYFSTGVYYMRDDFLPYVIPELVEKKYEKYFILSDKKMKDIMINDYLMDKHEVEDNFKILNSYPENIKHDYCFSSTYLTKHEYKDIIKNIPVTEKFDEVIYDIYLKKSREFRKVINDELTKLEKEISERVDFE